MGRLQVGHGSEYHLLRFMGRHRGDLCAAISSQLEADGVPSVLSVDWQDFPYNRKSPTWDGEILSVDFLAGCGGASWQEFWPDRQPGRQNRQGMPSWDAVGKVQLSNGETEWLIVEAKAHRAEFASPKAGCGAKGASRGQIMHALRATHSELALSDGPKWDDVHDLWMGRYYQLANRLAVLRFLRAHGHPARLLYIFFAGDSYRDCPSTGAKWLEEVRLAYTAMGLPKRHALSPWCHYLTLNVGTGQRV